MEEWSEYLDKRIKSAKSFDLKEIKMYKANFTKTQEVEDYCENGNYDIEEEKHYYIISWK